MDSVQTDPDDSIEFRRCWALGEAYYFLENKYETCFICDLTEGYLIKPPDSKDIRLYKSSLRTIKTVCNDLGIFDLDMNKFLNELHNNLEDISNKNSESKNKLDTGKDPKIYFEKRLEGYITGNLAGKDPRYNHIFRIAKHSMELYPEESKDNKIDQKTQNIKNDLESIRNFISDDRITLIEELLSNWSDVCKNYKDYKTRLEYNIGTSNSGYEKYKPPYLVEIVNRIGGLITGSIGVHDVLNKSDRTIWATINYIPLTFPAILILVIVLVFNFNFSSLNQFIPAKTEQLTAYILAFSALIGASLAVAKAFTPFWEKFTDSIALKLAILRLKNPKGWIDELKNLNDE